MYKKQKSCWHHKNPIQQSKLGTGCLESSFEAKRAVYPKSDVCASDGRWLNVCEQCALCGEDIYPQTGLGLISLQLSKLKVQRKQPDSCQGCAVEEQ